MKYAFNTIGAPQITRQIRFSGNSNPAHSKLFNKILTSYQEPTSRGGRIHHQGWTAADYLANPVHSKALKHMSTTISLSRNKASKNYDSIVQNELPRCKQRGVNRNIYNRPEGRGNQPQSRIALSEPNIIEKSITQAAAKYNLPCKLIKAVIKAESNFDAKAISSAGAQGLMQLMPATAEELGVKNSFDIAQNVDGGSRYLRKMLDRFNGDVKLALAAYNAGPGTVEKYDGNVPYRETQNYVKRVMRFSAKFA